MYKTSRMFLVLCHRLAHVFVAFAIIAIAFLCCFPPLPYRSVGLRFENRTLLFGHNGAGDLVPENVLESIRFAAEHRMDGVELDLQCSSDGILVSFHDWDLSRITGHDAHVDALTAAELQLLDAAHAFCADQQFSQRHLNSAPAAAVDSDNDNSNAAAASMNNQNNHGVIRAAAGTDRQQLRQRFCNGSAHHGIPSLHDAAALAEQLDLLLVLELKPGIAATHVPHALHALFTQRPSLYDRAVVLSFYPWLLYSVRARNPRIATGLLTHDRLLSDACTRPDWGSRLVCRVPLLPRLVDASLRFAARRLLPHYLGLAAAAPHLRSLGEHGADLAQWHADTQRAAATPSAISVFADEYAEVVDGAANDTQNVSIVVKTRALLTAGLAALRFAMLGCDGSRFDSYTHRRLWVYVWAVQFDGMRVDTARRIVGAFVRNGISFPPDTLPLPTPLRPLLYEREAGEASV